MGSETYEIIKLDGSDASIDTRNYFLGDGNGVNVFGIEAVTQSRHASCDLVKLDALLATICIVLVTGIALKDLRILPRFLTNMMRELEG